MGIKKTQIVNELNRVQASNEFHNKPVMNQLLGYLVNEYIEGRADQIKGFTIAVDVFGQGKSFDADKSALVRNSAVRLRGLLNTYYLGDGQSNPLRIDVPKGKYVPLITLNEMNSGNGLRVKNMTQVPGVAVLPFTYESNNDDYSYLASGFSQELNDALTKFDDLRVVGVGHQMGRDEDPRLLVEEVRNKHIDFLITGTVRVQRDEGVVLVRLTNALNDQRIWKKRYGIDLSGDNLFDLLEKISELVASHVGGEYGRINQVRLQALLQSKPQSLSEHQVLLKFYHTHAILTEEATIDFQQSLAHSLQENPDSPLLNALTASVYSTVWHSEFPGWEDALEKFAFYAEKAYALNPNHQLIASTLAAKCFTFDERDRFLALLELHEPAAANSPLRLGSWALYTCYFGEWERGMRLMQTVLENNIDVPSWIHGAPCMYQYREGRYEDALVEANKVHVPGLFWGPAFRSSTLGQLGRHEQAVREYKALLEVRPDFPERGRNLMGRFFKEPGLLEHFTGGFEKIGVTLS
jgi:TolB-like protein